MTAAHHWREWCSRATQEATARWLWLTEQSSADGAPLRRMDTKGWLKDCKIRLVRLEDIGLLDYRESQRLKLIQFGELAQPDRDRLRRGAYEPRYIAGLALAPAPDMPHQSQVQRCLRFRDGRGLRQGRLGLQVLIDTRAQRPIGMNVQLRGLDPRLNRSVYVRYDLDLEQMGRGPVSHFNAHWHHGDDPDRPEAEDSDPRLPCPILDPQGVLDILVETFFPGGPDDLETPLASDHGES